MNNSSKREDHMTQGQVTGMLGIRDVQTGMDEEKGCELKGTR